MSPAVHERVFIVNTAECEVGALQRSLTTGLEITFEDLFIMDISAMARCAGGEGAPETQPITAAVKTLMARYLDGIAAIRDSHQLTTGELMAMLAGRISRHARDLVRIERHGDTDTPGGWAKTT